MQTDSLSLLPPLLLGVHYCPNTPYPVEKKLGKNIALIDAKTGLPAFINDHGCVILEANKEYSPETLDSEIVQWWNKLTPEEQEKLKHNSQKRVLTTPSPASTASTVSSTNSTSSTGSCSTISSISSSTSTTTITPHHTTLINSTLNHLTHSATSLNATSSSSSSSSSNTSPSSITFPNKRSNVFSFQQTKTPIVSPYSISSSTSLSHHHHFLSALWHASSFFSHTKSHINISTPSSAIAHSALKRTSTLINKMFRRSDTESSLAEHKLHTTTNNNSSNPVINLSLQKRFPELILDPFSASPIAPYPSRPPSLSLAIFTSNELTSLDPPTSPLVPMSPYLTCKTSHSSDYKSSSHSDLYTEFGRTLSIETSFDTKVPTVSVITSYSPSIHMAAHFTMKSEEYNGPCWTKLSSKFFSIYIYDDMIDPPKYSFSFPNDGLAIYDENHDSSEYGFYFIFKYEAMHFITHQHSVALHWASSINSVNVTAFDSETPTTPLISQFSFDFRREYQELFQSFDFVELSRTSILTTQNDPLFSPLPRLIASLGQPPHSSFNEPGTLRRNRLKDYNEHSVLHSGRSRSSPDLLSTTLENGKFFKRISNFNTHQLKTSDRKKDSDLTSPNLNSFSPISNSDLKHTTLDQLLHSLLYQFEKDSFFVHAFLLGHRHFSTTQEVIFWLLAKFQKLLDPSSNEKEKEEYVQRQPMLRLRILRVLKFWMDMYPFDFFSASLRDILSSFFRSLLHSPCDPHEPSLVIEEQRKYFRILAPWMHRLLVSKKPNLTSSPDPIKMVTKATVLQFDAHEIAYELTNLEYARFKALRPLTFVLQLWSKDHDSNFIKQELKPLEEMAMAFNKISYWVATEICTQPEQSHRTKAFERFISIAKYCRRKNNFNTSMAIIAGLNNASVLRLKKTWDSLSSKSLNTYRTLESFFSQSHNYSQYRNVLAGLDRDRKTSFIPFLGLFMKDLYFFNENPIFVSAYHINFTKVQTLVSLLVTLNAWQSIPFTPHAVSNEVQDYCTSFHILNESKLYKYSCLCEGKKGDNKLKFSEKWAKESTHK